MNQAPQHRPVLVEQVADLFRPIEAGVIVDATFGGGGHTRRLLDVLDPGVRFLALDRDREAEARAATLGPRVRFVNADFRHLAEVAEEAGIDAITGVFFDLGLSSLQLDDPARGFGFRRGGPLDMRMGAGAVTADQMVNEWSEGELRRIIARYGEERFAARVARAILAARPISDTTALAEIIKLAIPAATRRTGGHPARRTFQALRIAVNDELAALEEGLDAALELVEPGGRVVVISYHSLEDRIVKRRLVSASSSPDTTSLPVMAPVVAPDYRLLFRKPITPDEDEIAANPRARSAKLRAVERTSRRRAA
jgi:16S rRNA (cytosine1402-N4)-methyltransferase